MSKIPKHNRINLEAITHYVWWNNSHCVWVKLLFCCWMLWMCLVCVVVLCWIDHVWSSKECVCFACDPNERLSAPCFVCIFVCQKLSPHLGVWELDHRCWLSSCYFFVWFCILCLLARTCSCYASCPLVCCACLSTVWCLWKLCWQCVCWWVWWSERKRTLCLL